MANILTFQNIMDAHDITEKEVPVPEWGGSVVVRSISHREMKNIKEKVKQATENDEELDDDYLEQQIILLGCQQPKMTEEEVNMLWDKNTKAVMTVLNGILGASKSKDDAVKEEEKSIPPATE